MPPRIDITNGKFGRLTAIECVGKDKSGYALWKCKCDCGSLVVVKGKSLRNGNTKSCGCRNIEEATKRIVNFNTKHSGSNTRLFRIWSHMKSRCYNSNSTNFSDYGGRGIAICEEWKLDFASFHEWAMDNGYDENAPRGKCTLDRIDVNGDYCPENCRWVDAKKQANNRRNNSVIAFNGETHTISEWADAIGMSEETLLKRLKSDNYTVERALTEPLNKRGKYDRNVTAEYARRKLGR